MGFHAKALPKIVRDVVHQSTAETNVKLEALKDYGIEVLAVTTHPGMAGSLSTGLDFAKYLSLKNHLPLIPIHHMEAHALTARMTHAIEFPFLVFLVSGGHCLLAMALDVNRYRLLGHASDNAPGQVFDKCARRLKLHTLRPDLRDVSGGKAIQTVAQEGNGDPTAFPFQIPMRQYRDCRFSFSGVLTNALSTIDQIEKEVKLEHDDFIPELPHFCAR